MPNTFYPTQIGSTISGSPNSSVVLGRDINSTWEAFGFGSQGRPDILEKVLIYLTTPSGGLSQKGVINIDVSQLVNIINGNSNAPSTGFQFALREVSVCETNDDGDTSEKKMMILGSQTYDPSS